MERYAPNAKDLASRDVVSRAMATEIKEGRGCGVNKDYVLLDITHLDPATIMSACRASMKLACVRWCRLSERAVAVVPTCHYQMGGIPTHTPVVS